MTLAWPTATLTLILLCLLWLAIQPAGAVRQCRDAYAAARLSTAGR